MKIAYLSASEIPSKSANSVQVMKMCEYFSKAGHEVVLFSRKSKFIDNVFEYYNVSETFNIVYTKWFNFRFIGGYLYGLRNKKKFSNDFDLIYGRDFYSLFFLRNQNVPIIYEAHTLSSYMIRNLLERIIFKSINFIALITISNLLRQDYEEKFNSAIKNKVFVLHDAADVKETGFESIRYPVKNIGYVGSLNKGKGLNIIISLASEFPNQNFIIVGNIPVKLRESEIPKNIIFNGFVSRNRLNEQYALFDIVLAPYNGKVQGHRSKKNLDLSRWMSPLKIFEYMAYEKLIIASDLPVIREVLYNMENSILCDPNQLDSWIKALNKVISNPSKYNYIVKKSNQLFIELYTWEKRVKKILEIFRFKVS